MSQRKLGLPRLRLTELCTWHIHSSSSCLLPTVGGSCLHATVIHQQSSTTTVCRSKKGSRRQPREHRAPDNLLKMMRALSTRVYAGQCVDLRAAQQLFNRRLGAGGMP